MNTHQISYSKLAEDGITLPTTHELQSQLSSIKSLSHGDRLILEGGKLLGYYSECLSAFFGGGHDSLCEEGAQSIIDCSEPSLICIQSPTLSALQRYRGYAERKLITEGGVVVQQLLVKAFGTPAWVNTPTNSVIVLEKDFRNESLAA